jgi:hypothetical protein
MRSMTWIAGLRASFFGVMAASSWVAILHGEMRWRQMMWRRC